MNALLLGITLLTCDNVFTQTLDITDNTTEINVTTNTWIEHMYAYNTIYRFWNTRGLYHDYIISYKQPSEICNMDVIQEEQVGRIIPLNDIQAASTACGRKLITITHFKRRIFGRNPVSLFVPEDWNNTLNGDWKNFDQYGCAKQMGDCGANFALTLYPSLGRHPSIYDDTWNFHTDLFYPSNDQQHRTVQAGHVLFWETIPIHICYIWK